MKPEVACLRDLLVSNARQYGTEPALLSEDLTPLNHGGLLRQVEDAIQVLNKLGIGRNDRVAIALPQGPELASVFLAVAAGATAAPLNYNYKKEDFAFYLKDLSARALVLLAGDDSPAETAAKELGVPVVEVIPDERVSGKFNLRGSDGKVNKPGGFAGRDEIGLMLHTSGTTSRPKLVPLTQGNLCASAGNIIKTLGLQPRDRCLNIMPLFHIHGLVACLLASLGAGGATVCTREFDAARFFDWLTDWQPSWYSAVPTMHQSILEQSHACEKKAVSTSLRFIRSSSAALPPPVMEGLETSFGIPVVESYGMTEAAHQMASNPLPPATRKPGSVGLAAGPEICILDEAGNPVSQGDTGEIAIRGENVMRGYENNPAANQTAFTDGWFRTGDQGYLDGKGYLFITGRLKEMINRGGENIAPRDIDEALLKHPEIKQAVGFAIPHPSLGEDVGAAVILAEGSTLDETAIRTHARENLPGFKVPSRILILKDIPKGPTGKLQRIGLAEKLKTYLKTGFENPESETEQTVAAVYEEVLGCSRIGRLDNFFYRGGDSLRSARALGRLNEHYALELPVTALFERPVVSEISGHIERLIENRELEALEAALAELTPEERDRLINPESHP